MNLGAGNNPPNPTHSPLRINSFSIIKSVGPAPFLTISTAMPKFKEPLSDQFDTVEEYEEALDAYFKAIDDAYDRWKDDQDD